MLVVVFVFETFLVLIVILSVVLSVLSCYFVVSPAHSKSTNSWSLSSCNYSFNFNSIAFKISDFMSLRKIEPS